MQERSQENYINIKIVDKNQDQSENHNPYSNIKIHSKSLFPDSEHVDDSYKIISDKVNKKTIKRLKEVYKIDTPLFPEDCQEYYNEKLSMPKPTYLSQIKMLPVSYYKHLISPSYVNKQGYYQIVVWKQGRMIKETIDDNIEYHLEKKCPILDQEFKIQPWLLILIKTWSKIKGGYSKVYEAQAFDFIRTFSFPIWDIINPCVQNKQQSREQLLKKLSRVKHKNELFIAKTKNKPQVGYYGFYPGCAAYKITGYYQDYEKVFIKLKTYVHGRWNGQYFSQENKIQIQERSVEENQFVMPLKQFLNVFNLVFFTLDFYKNTSKKVYYNRYHVSIDARQAKAKMITFNVENQCQIGINTYFPPSRTLDLYNPHPSKILSKQQQQLRIIVPYCKILIGKMQENVNLDASFVDSVRQNLLNDKNGDFISMKSHIQYQFIHCDYFKGYLNQVTFLLKLKPGKYYIRYKLQKIKSQYRIGFNTVATQKIVITDAKMTKTQMVEFLKETISSKARINQRNITYINPIKKGSWIIMNPDFDTMGYGYIVVQAIKNSQNKIIMDIDTGILKQNGYCIKGKKNVVTKFSLSAQNGQSFVLIVKKIAQYQKKHVWPPPGIQFKKIKRQI